MPAERRAEIVNPLGPLFGNVCSKMSALTASSLAFTIAPSMSTVLLTARRKTLVAMLRSILK